MCENNGGFNMEEITIYYEEKSSCQLYLKEFQQQGNVVLKKASDYAKEHMIFEKNHIVGFVFESDHKKIPYDISHIIWRLIMDKNGKCFVMVTGGQSELTTLKMAATNLESRGYKVVSGYTRYLGEKRKISSEEVVKIIIERLFSEEVFSFSEVITQIKKEVRSSRIKRHKIRKGIKDYHKYQMKHKNTYSGKHEKK